MVRRSPNSFFRSEIFEWGLFINSNVFKNLKYINIFVVEALGVLTP